MDLDLDEIAELFDTPMLRIDGFDDCCIGVCELNAVFVYDADKIVEKLIEQGMNYAEAVEYFCFNISCVYMGEGTPLIIKTLF